jgi:hypothetical protein
MRYQFFLITLCTILTTSVNAQVKIDLSSAFQKPVFEELKSFYSPSEGQLEEILKGHVISVGKVTSPSEKDQKLFLFVAGLHPRNCTRAMRKISFYENYSEYMDFIKKSDYSDEKETVYFVMDHTLLPFAMNLTFKIPRIKKPGVYPFTFEHGFLKDLKGNIIVKDIGKYCLLGLKTDWQGPETRIPNIAFSLFIQTVGKLGLEHLIRVSLF